MKIITVEERIDDYGLFKAGQAKQKANADYFTQVGTCFLVAHNHSGRTLAVKRESVCGLKDGRSSQ